MRIIKITECDYDLYTNINISNCQIMLSVLCCVGLYYFITLIKIFLSPNGDLCFTYFTLFYI